VFVLYNYKISIHNDKISPMFETCKSACSQLQSSSGAIAPSLEPRQTHVACEVPIIPPSNFSLLLRFASAPHDLIVVNKLDALSCSFAMREVPI